MTIRFQCSSCNFGLSAPDDKAGVSVKCPKCKGPVEIPWPVEAVEEVMDVLPAEPIQEVLPAHPMPPPPVLAGAQFAFDDRSGPFSDDPGQFARGQYATCPYCGNPGHADRVSFTWWGGFLGPAILNHVQCRRCRQAYNGRSGQPNTTGIIIYCSIGGFIGLAVACAAVIPTLGRL